MFNRQPFRVYIDGIFDLLHEGHIKLFTKAINAAKEKADGRPIELIVGVTTDQGVEDYKRKPIMTMSERGRALLSQPLVTEVIESSPMITTAEFIRDHKINLVVHGDDFSDEKVNVYYKAAVIQGKYASVPYEPGVSTSELLRGAKFNNQFPVSMEHCLVDVSELLQRVQHRSCEELRIAPVTPAAVMNTSFRR